MKKINLYILLSLFISCTTDKSNEISFRTEIFTASKCNFDYEEMYTAFKNDYKKAIPALINKIDTDSMGFVGKHLDSLSSSFPSFIYNYVGMRAAFMIERIISNSGIEKSCRYDVIFKRKTANINDLYKGGDLKIDMNDMKAIKKIYAEWWEQNKEKKLAILIEDAKEYKTVLSQSDYTWK